MSSFHLFLLQSISELVRSWLSWEFCVHLFTSSCSKRRLIGQTATLQAELSPRYAIATSGNDSFSVCYCLSLAYRVLALPHIRGENTRQFSIE